MRTGDILNLMYLSPVVCIKTYPWPIISPWPTSSGPKLFPSCFPIESVRGVLCPFSLRGDKPCGRTCVSDAQCTMWKSIHRVHSVVLFLERLYRTTPYQSSRRVAGSTFFRSACTGVGPIFQRIIRVPLSQSRICRPMRFGLFLPDFAQPNITPGYKSPHLNNTV